MVIFKLSKELGGRDEVLNTPFNELLAHLMTHFQNEECKAEKEQADYYMNFVAMLNSNPQSKEQMKSVMKFMKEIQPKKKVEQSSKPKKKYQWNERVQKKIEARKRAEQNM
ncbi:hypothetical protein [Mammaliicoccus vitulinus]|uniref:hypothetical protein n=1 Tax=Mammaliicoccus vitulinus TaxID=71237 RepID=UPI0028D254F4|nr:hypothetical protein [Mammaliicoccus vitulinus]